MKWIITFLLVLFSSQAFSENLCPTTKVHDLVIGEDEYTMENALSALQNLEQRIPELIAENHEQQIRKIQEDQRNNEPLDIVYMQMTSELMDPEFYIGYPNRLAIIRGALLKQNVLALNYSDKQQEYNKALERFCAYVKHASFVD